MPPDPYAGRGWAGGWSWLTADGLVIGGPVLLWGAWLVASSAGAATATLYEGDSTAGRTILTLSAPASELGPFEPRVALPCDRGLYLDVGSNVTGVLIVWDRLPPA